MKKITFLITFFSVISFINLTAKGEVQYTDIEPDIVIPTASQQEEIGIDLGFSTGDEIVISIYNFTQFLNISINGENGARFSGEGDISEAIVASNTIIGPELAFNQIQLSFDNPGNFEEQDKDYYLAVRVESNSQFYYGWIRIAQTGSSQWTIKDFAIQDTPDTPITPDGSNNGGGTGEIGDFAISLVEDVDETHSASDINVHFNGAEDETGVLHYRLIVAPEQMQNTLTVDQAILLNPTRYFAVQPGFENYQTTLQQDQKDAEGNDIQNQKPYVVFILAMAKNNSGLENKLSAPSDPITLQTLCPCPDTIKVKSIKTEAQEGPIELSFNYLENQENNLEFRVFAIHNDDQTPFTIEVAENISQGNYEVIDPNTSNNTFLLSLNKDINGNDIDPLSFYKYAVLAVPDITNTDVPQLSKPSNPVAITPNGFIHAGETIELLKSSEIEKTITLERSQFNRSLEIDLDEDEEADIKITVNVSSDATNNSRQVTATSLGALEISTYPQLVLEPGDQISNLCSYTKNKIELFNISGNDEVDGPWSEKHEKFMAIRKNLFQGKQLGWIKISSDTEKVTIHSSMVVPQKSATSNNDVQQNKLQVYPSPADDIIYVSNSNYLTGTANIKVFDISGKKVKSLSIDSQILLFNGINITDLHQGVYFIEITDNNYRVIDKFIKD